MPSRLVVLLALTWAPGFEQQPAVRYSTIVQDMRDREFATIRGDLTAAAELMPEDRYAWQPVETVRTFGGEIAHATAVNRRLCGMASGAVAPPAVTPAAAPDKATLVAALKDSFEQCAKVFAGATDESALVPTTGPYIRASHLTAMLGHNNEVYGKVALMLRLQGLVPPSTARQKRQKIA